MSMAIERYNEAQDLNPANHADFTNYFLGTLAAKFDYNLDSRAWDDALAKATAFAARRSEA